MNNKKIAGIIIFLIAGFMFSQGLVYVIYSKEYLLGFLWVSIAAQWVLIVAQSDYYTKLLEQRK